MTRWGPGEDLDVVGDRPGCSAADCRQIREEFRHHSLISPVARAVIAGLDAHDWVLAVEALQICLPQPDAAWGLGRLRRDVDQSADRCLEEVALDRAETPTRAHAV